MLYHHSHDSLKVNTLNFKFFWYDLLTVIDYIDDGIIDKGNIDPYLDEMQLFYENDLVAKDIYKPGLSLLFRVKDSNGKYTDKLTEAYKNRTSETTISMLKQVGRFIVEDLESNNRYFSRLVYFIKKLCMIQLNYEQERELYSLSQSFLSELINRDYTQEFIFQSVMDIFFSGRRVESPEDSLGELLRVFDFKKRDYIVFFPLSQSARKELTSQFDIVTCNNVYDMFGVNFPYIGKMKVTGFDPDQARTRVANTVDLMFAIIQYEKHYVHSFVISSADIIDTETNHCYSLRKPIPPILRRNGYIDRNIFSSGKSIQGIDPLFRAFSLHSSAIRSNNIDNQLLNLWTAIEAIIPVERQNSFSKINQICNSLTTILGIIYFRSLLIQLAHDVKSVCEEDYLKVLQTLQGEFEYQKLALLLALPENATLLNSLKDKLSKYPLLVNRLAYYSSTFSDLKLLSAIYEKHITKLRCQIMRVYRCRNLIVHNGKGARYTELIIQNLHFYFDTLVDTIFTYSRQDMIDIEAILKKVAQDELSATSLMKSGEKSATNILNIIG